MGTRNFVLRSLSFAEIGALSVAILYALGFVVANSHLSRYELVRFDLLRVRYAAAGLLLAFCLLIPALLGFNIGTHYRNAEPKPRWERQRSATMSFVLVAALATPLVRGLLTSITVSSVPWVELISFVLPSIALAATTGSGIAKFMRRGTGPLSRRGASPGRIISVLLMLVGLAAIFGRGVYPYISQPYGGGAAVLAEVSIDSRVLPTHLHVIMSRLVVILDRSEREVNLLGCVDTGTGRVRPVSVPVAAVRSVMIERQIVAPVADTSLCRLAVPQ